MMMNISKDNAYLKLHTAVFLAGGTGIFGRLISLSELPLVWYRILIGLVCFGLFLAYYRKLCSYRRGAMVRILLLGSLLAFHWVAFYAAIKASNVSIAVCCIALDGFFTALFDPVISRRRVRLSELLLSAISFLGIVLIFGFNVNYRTGILWGVACSMCYAVFAIVNKRLQAAEGVTSSNMLFYEMVGGLIFLSLLLPFYHEANPAAALVPDERDGLLLIVFSTVFTIGPFLLQLQALRSISAFTVNLTYNLESVYSIVIAMILFDEGRELNVYFWLGVAMIIASVALQTLYSRREERGRG